MGADEPFVVDFVSGIGLPSHDTTVSASASSLLQVEKLSDPYVRCELKDARGKTKGPVRWSEPKPRNLNPVWHFIVDFDIRQGDVHPSDQLHVEVYDYDMASADDLMGCARISVGSLVPEGKRYLLSTGALKPTDVEPDCVAPPSGDSDVCALTVRRVPIDSLPQKMTVFMVRHGESMWNQAQDGKNLAGMYKQVDHPLNVEGIQQCVELQHKIASKIKQASQPDSPTGTAAQIVADLFDASDSDGSGYLDVNEGKHFLQIQGCAEDELDYYWTDLLRVADANKDGKISKAEFLEYLLGHEELNGSGDFADKERAAQLKATLRTLQQESTRTAVSQPEAEPVAEAKAEICESTPPKDAVGVEDWLAAQAIYASPLRRTVQTCLIGVKGHPALRRTAEAGEGLPLTLLACAREKKNFGKERAPAFGLLPQIVVGGLRNNPCLACASASAAVSATSHRCNAFPTRARGKRHCGWVRRERDCCWGDRRPAEAHRSRGRPD